MLSIYNRYGFYDRCFDSPYVNRREWDFNYLYEDWNKMGFFNKLREKGYITVAYDSINYKPFNIEHGAGNRHQLLALSCFIDSQYKKSAVLAPHEKGGEFCATFEKFNDNTIIYYGNSAVWFKFDNSKISQI